MALPTNTFTQFDSVGNREDLSDVIYDVSPVETPFASGIKRVSASAVLHEWQTDVLDTASANNAALEGDDATAAAITPTVRVTNRCQIMDKVITVSGTQRAIDTAGRSDELDYQTVRKGRELKRDVESAICGVNAQTAGSTATARLLGGVETYLATNLQKGDGSAGAATGTTPGGGAAVVDGSGITLTPVTLKTAIDNVISLNWDNGGDSSVIMLGSAAKKTASKMAGIATLYRDNPANAQGQIIGGADSYVSDFGNHTIVPNRFMRSRTVLILDMEFFAIAELRGMQTTELAKTGDNDKVQLITELTLEVRNELSSGKISDALFA